MTVRELIRALEQCDDSLEVCIDADSVSWYQDGEDPELGQVKYIEDGFTEGTIPSKAVQQEAEHAYILLAN
jgi:hypothetical protein